MERDLSITGSIPEALISRYHTAHYNIFHNLVDTLCSK
jgi:hypothetical protein